MRAGAILLVFIHLLISCGHGPEDPRSYYNPKFFREGTSIPFLDEYNVMDVQLIEIDNPFPEASRKRIYSLWFRLDGRGRFALHAESGDFRGQTIHMFIYGQSVGYHPIQRAISNGVLPILLDPKIREEDARFLHQQIQRAVVAAHKKR